MAPIFIIGITQRSGTNFLANILKSHPDCVTSNPPPEDFLLAEIKIIEKYVKKTRRYWYPEWGDNETFKKELKLNIGYGLQKFREPLNECLHYITKTPDPTNLKYFKEYFPDSRLIIIIRRGQDVVESGIRSKFWGFYKGCLKWKYGANEIIKFLRTNYRNSLIVQYEDLNTDLRNQVIKICQFCDLTIDTINWDSIENQPITGSSQIRSKNGSLTWKPQQKTKDFNPLNRSHNWPVFRQYAFEWICGKESSILGYKYEVNKSFLFYSIVLISWIPYYFSKGLFYLKKFVKHHYLY